MDVLTLLIHIGYLGYDSSSETAFIPNEEVRQLFKTAVKDSGWIEVERAIQLSNRFMESMLAMNADDVAKASRRVS